MDWAGINLVFAEYKTRGPVILKGSDTAELIEKLEDSQVRGGCGCTAGRAVLSLWSDAPPGAALTARLATRLSLVARAAQMTLGSMATNRYSAPFREEVQGWIVKLSTVSEIVEQWLMVQNMWMYMEAVFSGGDIVKQLPQEAKRFQNIDKNYMKIVTSALETLNVVNTCYGNELMKNMLPHLLEQLELCQKSLSAYLETKRAEFPRFYFVSDPTLLEILSLGSDPPSVVPHFQSGLFDSLTNVTFDKVDKTRMTEMFSQQAEKVEFEKPVDAKGNIEVWLQRLVDGMQDTVKQTIKRAVRNVQVRRRRVLLMLRSARARRTSRTAPRHRARSLTALASPRACCSSRRVRAGDGAGRLHLQQPRADLAARHPVPVDGRHAGGALERQDRQDHHDQEHEEGARAIRSGGPSARTAPRAAAAAGCAHRAAWTHAPALRAGRRHPARHGHHHAAHRALAHPAHQPRDVHHGAHAPKGVDRGPAQEEDQGPHRL